MLINCKKCGRPLIERASNGLFRFKYGRNGKSNYTPVDILILGSIKMKCFREDCGEYNTLLFFPQKLNLPEESALNSK